MIFTAGRIQPDLRWRFLSSLGRQVNEWGQSSLAVQGGAPILLVAGQHTNTPRRTGSGGDGSVGRRDEDRAGLFRPACLKHTGVRARAVRNSRRGRGRRAPMEGPTITQAGHI